MGIQFIWEDAYSVGNTDIDEQHKRIFSIANSLHEDIDSFQINRIIMAFFRHVREHFSIEEKMMRELGFPELSSHRDLHNDLITKLNKTAASSFINNQEIAAFKQFVYDWVTDHILNYDMEYVRFAHIQGRPLTPGTFT